MDFLFVSRAYTFLRTNCDCSDFARDKRMSPNANTSQNEEFSTTAEK